MPRDESYPNQMIRDSEKIENWDITKEKFKINDIVVCTKYTKHPYLSDDFGKPVLITEFNESYYNSFLYRDCHEVTHLYCLEMYTNNGRDIEFAWVRAASEMDAIETAGLVVWNFHECISCSQTTGITKLALGPHNSAWGINLHQSDYGSNHNRIRDVKFRVLLST